MGRTKKNSVYRYFELAEDKKTSKCLVEDCGKIFKTQHGSNLLKHLKHVHPEKFKLTIQDNNPIPTQKTNITESTIEECTKLVAVHGRPFTIIDDVAFQNLLKMIPDNNVPINSRKIRSNIQSMAEKLRYEMGTMLQGKTLCLKVDIASIATRCFLGINCQYLEDGHIVLKNLAVTEIFDRHTSDHLKDLLLFNLQRFRIDTHQIYSITTDIGANMIKMTKLINEASMDVTPHTPEAGTSSSSSHILLSSVDLDSDTDSDADSDQETETHLGLVESITNRLLVNIQIQVQNTEIGPQDVSEYSIGLVRCAAHTLQLALQDASNNVYTRALLTECREVVRRLRTPQFVRIIRQENKCIPKLDCTTRWHSAIDMAQSLIFLKELCTSYDRLHLPLATWNALEAFVEAMTPAKVLTKTLQEEQLTVGDFYLQWMLCQYKLAKINSDIASNIITEMKSRENLLFGSDTFINAIFMDPRVNSILTPDQRRQAKDNLIKLFVRHFRVQQRDFGNTTERINERHESSEARAELDDFLNERYIDRLTDLTSLFRRDDFRSEVINNLNQSFTLFLEKPLLKSTENVLSYWEKTKLKFPLLYKLSSIVLATPITQVSVERLFSSLRFILSNYRFSMKDNIIEDVLFLRSNSIFSK